MGSAAVDDHGLPGADRRFSAARLDLGLPAVPDRCRRHGHWRCIVFACTAKPRGRQSLVAAASERGTTHASGQESKNVDNGADGGAPRHNNRAALFALLVVCREVSVVVGPLVGSLLLNTGFDTSLFTAAAVLR